jgi:hypothetical protein
MTAQPTQPHSPFACLATSQLLATHLVQQYQRRLQQLLLADLLLRLPELLLHLSSSDAHCKIEERFERQHLTAAAAPQEDELASPEPSCCCCCCCCWGQPPGMLLLPHPSAQPLYCLEL